ncbi:tyrosinase-like [Stylophora pistillata]|uniref:Tyrosinase n=1 Tax=Stylophora pistillata TaxID=50429 RepID=A0A2B4R7J8_STYPI|nr:tyrosinase-like [Stylophora pistillata]XP_022810578.1 tyrosinase-like [Stylophora pistillata]PFX12202.1 Tyrosinase [Stylophora pistillata]PFX27653.1 Tyrosinase [Stylophora pistillata]
MAHPIIAYLVFVVVTLPWVDGQFPRVCTNLDSLRRKECCPIPKGFTTKCGCDGDRGKCQELVIRDWTFKYSHYQPFQNDDERHDWPHALYHKVCKCNKNYAGYDCSKCAFGYYRDGSNCTQKNLIRRNFLNLSLEEKDRYMRYVNMSKYYESDYVVTSTPYAEINETVMKGGDPKGFFYNVTSYDLFTWMHYYAARNTILPHNITKADIDFAHDGQGFPSWHRLYLLAWERTLQEIGNDEEFALPFWDWTGNITQCDPAICSEELLGVTNQSNGIVMGKYLDEWYVLCTDEQTYALTEPCDPTKRRSKLQRGTDNEKEAKKKNQGYDMTFPTKKDVNFALRFDTFDLPPYSKESSCNFKNILEGYASTETGYRFPNIHGLHNRVHIVVGGEMGDVPSASNDPIFPLHHAFVDRIYEKWLRKFNEDASVLSTYDAPLGHNKDDVIVPLFPVYSHRQMFKKSFEFGYDYEDVDENGKSSDDEEEEKPLSLGDCPAPCYKRRISAVAGKLMCWWLMLIMPVWQLLLAD